MVDDANPPERPRAEPEIIPPDRSSGRGGNSPWQTKWQSNQRFYANGPDGVWRNQRIFVMRPGPLGFIAIMLILGLVVAAIFVALIGTLLIWIPAVALCVAIAAVYRFLRR
jgi:hypothetical protein